MWLAIDVWLCTASILNLCAISLDRYIDISRPLVRYPTLMSPYRTKLLIVCVWILSFLICFPPLLGWNDSRVEDDLQLKNESSNNQLLTSPIDVVSWDSHLAGVEYQIVDQRGENCKANRQSLLPECNLTLIPGYIVYSACGSFWVPMLGMIIFYWKIYKTAVAATDAVNRGFVDQKPEGGSMNANPLESVPPQCRLRIHRGGSSSGSVTAVRLYSTGSITDFSSRQHSATRHSSVDGRLQTTTDRSNAIGLELLAKNDTRSKPEMESRTPPLPTIVITSSTSYCDENKETDVSLEEKTEEVSNEKNENAPVDGDDDGETDGETDGLVKKRDSVVKIGSVVIIAAAAELDSSRANNGQESASDKTRRKSSFLGFTDSPTTFSLTSSNNSADKRTFLIATRFAKLHFISQLRNLNKEKRAAKTVGIIVGCFMVCWAPFFTVYLAEAFCRRCTPTVVFHVFFWLGYCNSAVNPFIYGLCSRDFRYAFRKFLHCRCMRKKPALLHESNGRMMAMLQTLTMQVIAKGAVTSAAPTCNGITGRQMRTKKTVISL